MPGIHFIHSDDESPSQTDLDALLDNQLHDDDYVCADVYADASTRLAITRYPQYPVQVFDLPDYLIVLEGRLYHLGDAEIRTDLIDLCDSVFGDESHADEAVRSWLLNHDGDFVVVMRHKPSGQWAFVNDVLGRLPMYYYGHRDFDCLSREIGLVTRLSEQAAPDPMGMAQYLVFGFPLGPRMLWQNVERLAPATLLRWRKGSERADRKVLHVFDFDNQIPGDSVAPTAEELVSLFVSACKSRADENGNNLLSLSGGLDSRSVAAGLQKTGCDFGAATFGQSSEQPSADLRIARQLATALNLNWEHVGLPGPTGRNAQQILRLKGGLINSSQAYDVSYFAHLRSRHGRDMVHFSGDGGDKLLPSLHPDRTFTSLSDLAGYILQRHHLMQPAQVAKLTRLPVGDLTGELTGLLDSYPEKSFAGKYVHFVIYERAVHWLFEGEDRNRCALWSCTPFYSSLFFAAAMGCRDSLKKNHRLYREFLLQLSPVAADIDDAGKGLSLTDPAYARRIARASTAARFPRLARLATSLIRKGSSYSAESSIARCLRKQRLSEDVLGEWFDRELLQFLADHPDRLGRAAFENLFALSTTIIAHLGRESSTMHISDEELF